jgi:hypothetical protein
MILYRCEDLQLIVVGIKGRKLQTMYQQREKLVRLNSLQTSSGSVGCVVGNKSYFHL